MIFADVPWIAVAVVVVLLAGAAAFLIYFVIPAVRLSTALKLAVKRLEASNAGGEWNLGPCFDGHDTLTHIWTEFRETLHEQKAIDPATQEHVVVAVRSTVPAETFFSPQIIVDGRVHAEFFRHLPGIFTGVGIIGTFTGLIRGLQAFQISEDSNVVRNSLNNLLHGVSEAFLVSALAILLAMVATTIEKWFINRLYGKVERLNQLLDAAYEAGAGEEYLSRLVTASEESSSQTKILKDSLVSDLKQILTELAERQIAATDQSTAKLSEAITETLREPLDRIAGGVNRVSEDQSSAVTKLLTDVLAGFSEKLESMFGSQLSGIGEMQLRTIQAMDTAVGKLQELTGNIESAGTRATNSMTDSLKEALEAAEARQRATNDAMNEMLAAVRKQTSEAQQETRDKLAELLGTLGEKVGAALAGIEDQSARRAADQAEREERTAARTVEQVEKIGGEVTGLSAGVDALLTAVREMIERIEGTTGTMVSRLNSGAETLLSAANQFEQSGREASTSFAKMAGVAEGLNGAATTVAGAARSLDSVVADYRAARESVGQMLVTIKDTVEAASRDVSMTSDIISRIEGAAAKLAAAQNQADSYLDEVTDVIAESHQRFSDGMRQTVGEANTEFHKQLSQATGLLREAIQELELALPAGSSDRRGGQP